MQQPLSLGPTQKSFRGSRLCIYVYVYTYGSAYQISETPIPNWGVSKIRSCKNACFHWYWQCFQKVCGSGGGGGVSIYIYIHIGIDIEIDRYIYIYTETYVYTWGYIGLPNIKRGIDGLAWCTCVICRSFRIAEQLGPSVRGCRFPNLYFA